RAIARPGPLRPEISFNLLRIKYKEKATFEQIEAIYRPVLDFASGPLYELAEKLITQPAQYEQMLSKAAAMRPAFYYTLGEYFADLKNDQKAAFYLEKGIELGGDAVAASYRAGWLIKYYQRMGENEKAQKLADFAGEVYSHRGLTAKAEFLEATERYREAFEWYAKIEERYEDSTPLVAFCVRYKATTGDKRFDR